MTYEAETARLSVLIRTWYQTQSDLFLVKHQGKSPEIVAIQEELYANAEADLSDEAKRIIAAEKACPALPWATSYEIDRGPNHLPTT